MTETTIAARTGYPEGRSSMRRRSSRGGGSSRSTPSEVSALYDPWGRSLLQALRQLWWIPVVLAVLGAVAGGLAGAMAQPSAEAKVRVQAPVSDGVAMTRAVTTAAEELDTAQNFAAATAGTTVGGADLRGRTEIAPATDSQVLTVTVTAPTLAQAVSEADAIVAVGIQRVVDRQAQDVTAVTEETRELIASSRLSNAAAEKARVESLGTALAASQADLVANAGQLTSLSPATSSSITPGSALLAAMGLAGGALAGVAVALLVGGRRGRVTSAKELRRLYPHLPVIDHEDLDTVVEMEAETTSTWVVGGTERSDEQLQAVADAVLGRLSAAGVEARASGSLSALGDRQGVDASSVSEVHVVTTRLNQAIVRAVERDGGAALLLVVQLRHTRREWLDEYVGSFGERTYLVVGDPRPDWAW